MASLVHYEPTPLLKEMQRLLNPSYPAWGDMEKIW